ncbi:DUF3302 domain-containing protein [Salinicola avicenniae]|uniref:DUF3302 domain-containing protein n=1 Tax=Salinicola avicenniae TaxID=2916836 RepID=UPI002073E268|nr:MULTISPECIES: DUF3302 domain-containing protein [unclassified Salinicola]
MLSYIALGLLIFVALVLFYGIIAVHDIPYLIAKRRDHPHQDAIHIAGWVSLFTLHVLWPFLWIWATLYRPERGWGFRQLQDAQLREQLELERLRDDLERMRARVAVLEASAPAPPRDGEA